jgi:outer membrane protein TolC
VRNSVRQARYTAQVSAADLVNTRLTAQATLAELYFQLRGQDALEAVYRATIEADQRALELTRARAETGVDTWEAVAQAEVTLTGVEAAEAGLAINRALFEHAIATLVGTPASQFTLPVRLLTTPVPAIPVSVPSQLLERRPDVAAAERAVAAANAAIGVARAG